MNLADLQSTAVLLVAQGAGIVLLLSTVVLLFMRRIYLDVETKQPVQFEMPLIGEIKTQSPVIVLVLISAGLVLYPLHLAANDQATVEGDVNTDGKSVTVTIVPVPQYQETLDASGHFKLKIPLIRGSLYRVKFIVEGRISSDQEFEFDSRGAKLQPFTYVSTKSEEHLPARKDISDEKLKSLHLY